MQGASCTARLCLVHAAIEKKEKKKSQAPEVGRSFTFQPRSCCCTEFRSRSDSRCDLHSRQRLDS